MVIIASPDINHPNEMIPAQCNIRYKTPRHKVRSWAKKPLSVKGALKNFPPFRCFTSPGFVWIPRVIWLKLSQLMLLQPQHTAQLRAFDFVVSRGLSIALCTHRMLALLLKNIRIFVENRPPSPDGCFDDVSALP